MAINTKRGNKSTRDYVEIGNINIITGGNPINILMCVRHLLSFQPIANLIINYDISLMIMFFFVSKWYDTDYAFGRFQTAKISPKPNQLRQPKGHPVSKVLYQLIRMQMRKLFVILVHFCRFLITSQRYQRKTDVFEHFLLRYGLIFYSYGIGVDTHMRKLEQVIQIIIMAVS